MLQDERVDVNKQDKYNRTPIWIACNNNRTQVVQIILQSGRNINLDTKYNNTTPLEQARQKGHQEIVNLIENYMKSEPVSQSKKINKKKQNKKTKQKLIIFYNRHSIHDNSSKPSSI